jgi:hypothetical protein
MQRKGGFAGAVGAQQGHALSGIEMEIDSIERDGSVGIAVAETADVNDSTHATMWLIRSGECPGRRR